MSAAFHDLLDRMQIPFDTHQGTRIAGDAHLAHALLTELPEELHVQGSLDVSYTGVSRLPRILTVQGHLRMKECAVLALPEILSVGGDVVLDGTRISALPKGFRVPGTLSLSSTPITALPDGLHVGGALDLGQVRLQRFPEDMCIDGPIFPPDGLLDVPAFMATHPPKTITNEVMLSYPSSQHHRLAMKERLRPYPNLWRIVAALKPRYHLMIWRAGPDFVLGIRVA